MLATLERTPPSRGNDEIRLGRVISVASAVVMGVLQPEATSYAEIGALVRLQGRRGLAYGVIVSLAADGRRRGEDERCLVEIRLVGELVETTAAAGLAFQRGVSRHPPLDAPIFRATAAELKIVYARPDVATVRLGTLRQAPDLDAFAITDRLLGKHFAVLGTTGAGKSCAVTLILRAILDAHPAGHVVMLDPHNEYARAFGTRAERLDPQTFKLPFWLLDFEELAHILVSREAGGRSDAERTILRRALLSARRGWADDHASDSITVDTPIPYRLSELARRIREEMGAFDKADGSAPYQHLLARIETVTTDRRFGFMFSSFAVHDSMAEVLARVLRIPTGGRPITILDISGVPSEIVDVTVSVLFRLIFEFALWSDRRTAPPILLVCEEAHRYVPREGQNGFGPTRRAIGRIAKEGRKYGIGLGLVSQRPAELDTSSLSQCNTVFALRLTNEHDLDFVRHTVPDGSKWLIDTLPALNVREAIVIGEGVPLPAHVCFDDLPAEARPASTNPVFASAWQADEAGAEMVAETVARWRRQARDPVIG
jgi:hypothetical protein